MTQPATKSGKPDIWVDAEVWVSDEDDPKVNKDGTFGEEWDLVGLLSGSDGFTQNREFSTAEAQAWGKGIVDQADHTFKSTGGFTALEDNNVTRYLIWPGSTAHVMVVPKPAFVHLAYVTTNKDGDTEILMTRKKARVFAPSVSKTEEVSGTAFEVTHFADSKGALFDRLVVDANTGAVKEFTPIRIKDLTTAEKPLNIKGEAITNTAPDTEG